MQMGAGGGVSKFLLEKGGLSKMEGGSSRNGGLPYYIEVFLEIPYDAHRKKS